MDQDISFRCPDDKYDWESLHYIGEDGAVIECDINKNTKLVLKAKKSPQEYQIYFKQNNSELFLGDYPIFTTSKTQFNVDQTKLDKLIHVYNRQYDGGGFTENGWFINQKSEQFIKYWTNTK